MSLPDTTFSVGSVSVSVLCGIAFTEVLVEVVLVLSPIVRVSTVVVSTDSDSDVKVAVLLLLCELEGVIISSSSNYDDED